jgi:hypothetical protein
VGVGERVFVGVAREAESGPPTLKGFGMDSHPSRPALRALFAQTRTTLVATAHGHRSRWLT